jgi:hypothetical protein
MVARKQFVLCLVINFIIISPSYCLEEIGTTRNKTLVKAYIDALTKGGPNGVPRPIEMQAHDPRRFVGDMAAWLHQALAGEQEMCSSMLRLLRRGAYAPLVRILFLASR